MKRKNKLKKEIKNNMQNQIPKNWQVTTLAGTTTLNYGKGLPETTRTAGMVPVYGSSGITGYHNTALVNEPGYIIGRKGTVGSIYHSEAPFYPIDTVYYSTKSDIKCDFNFFYYLLKTLKLNKLNGDSAVPGLNRETAYVQKVLLPSTPEQKKIASILFAFDDKIEVNNKIAKTLEEIAQSIFKEWFVNFKFPGYEKVEFADNEFGVIPKVWRISKLKELVNIRNGFAFKSGDYESKGVPIIRTMNFTDSGSVQLNDIVYLSEKTAKKYNGFYLEKFDFLLVMVGASVGKYVIVPSNILPALQNQNMWNFMPKKEAYRFFNIYLLKKLIREQRGSTTGSARDFFRKDYFYSLDVFVPDSEILKVFNELIEPIYTRLDTMLNENKNLVALRDLLLPKLMRGEIRV